MQNIKNKGVAGQFTRFHCSGEISGIGEISLYSEYHLRPNLKLSKIDRPPRSKRVACNELSVEDDLGGGKKDDEG
jgi:hypothetical protein